MTISLHCIIEHCICWNQNIFRELGQHHGCWCPGTLYWNCRQFAHAFMVTPWCSFEVRNNACKNVGQNSGLSLRHLGFMESLSRVSTCTSSTIKCNRQMGHLIRLVNCDVTGPLWHHKKICAMPRLGSVNFRHLEPVSHTRIMVQNKWVLVFHKEEFQIPEPFQCG